MRKFIILMPWGRVGSNAVCAALNARAHVRVDNEPLTAIASRLRGQNDEIVARAQRDWLRRNYFGNAPRDVALHGVKIAVDSLRDLDHLLAEARAQCIPVVVMRRRNALAVAVSVMQAERHGTYRLRDAPAIDVDVRELLRKARHAKRADERLRSAVHAYAPIAWIDFEDWSDAHACARDIYNFALNDSAQRALRVSIHGAVQRVERPMHQRIRNYADVEATLQSAEWQCPKNADCLSEASGNLPTVHCGQGR